MIINCTELQWFNIIPLLINAQSISNNNKGLFFFFTVQWDIDYYSTLEAHSEFFR